MTNERIYRPYVKRQLVRGVLICGPAEYAVSWDTGVQRFDRPHVRAEVPRAGGGPPEVYGIGLDAFIATYVDAEELGVYRKRAVTWARVVEEGFPLTTERKGETTAVAVRAGDYMVREEDGVGEYHVKKEQFEEMYAASSSEDEGGPRP